MGTGARAEINITPLIDVLLVLLVIFMVTIEIRKTLAMQLAQQQAQGARTVQAPIVLEMGDDGTYTLNRIPVPRAVLGSRLRAVYAGRTESVLFVRSGSRRPYRDLIEVVDVARGAGVQVIALAAESIRP